jgi:WD40 repeat protein/serine/threonine protein kinase
MEIGKQLRAYEIRDQIGTGGFGEVYRAYQPVIGREVAIKVILPEYANQPDFVRRFEGEAQLVARLEHPHIVPLYDYWRDPDGAYLVMRYIRGGSLSRSVKNEGAWPLDRAADMLDQISSALALAHRVGVVHRDIKPDNILLDEDGNAYLTDFGIAKRTQTESADDDLTSGTLAYIAPEQLSGQPAVAATDQYALALVLAEVIVGRHVYGDASVSEMILKHLYEPMPDLRALRVALPDSVNDVLFKATAKDPDSRYPTVSQFADAFRHAALGKDSTQEMPAISLDLDRVVNPYKGLRPFQQADSTDFYGREMLINRLLARMEEELPSRNFLAVVGASGSGKSSAVKAGLIPTLRGGSVPGSENWFIVEMTPGMNPLRELESSLLGVAQRPVNGLGTILRSGPNGLAKAVEAVLPEGELLLFIDQFEETFTLSSELDANRLLAMLANATHDPKGRVRVVITLRADFLDRPLNHPIFGDLLRRRVEFVLPLTPSELERAITGPVERLGLEADPALVARMAADVSEEPGALPLMQYALTEVFERRSGRILSLSAYEKIGGVTGALARRADEVYNGLNEPGKAALRQIMLRLLTLGEGKEDTRRRAALSELVSVIPDSGVRQTVLDAFTRARLLTFDQDQQTRDPVVEVAHEALIREWRLLRTWLDDSRADVRQQRQLAAAATDWAESRRDPSYLLTGGRLAQYEEWTTTTSLVLTPAERDFLSASSAERIRREQAELAREAREAALEARSRTILRVLVGVFAAAAVISVALFIVALRSRQVAEENAARAEDNFERAEALRIASAANVLLYGQEANAETGALLAIRSLGALYSTEADAALVQSRSLMYSDRVFDLGAPLVSVAAAPDGTLIAAGSDDGALAVLDALTGQQRWGYQGRTTLIELTFSPDGRWLAASQSDGTLLVFNAADGTLHRPLPTREVAAHSLIFSPDSSTLLSADAEGLLTTWDVRTGQLISEVQAELQETSYDLALLPDGQTAVVAGYFEAPLIDLTTGEVPRVYDSLNNGLTGVAVGGGLLLTTNEVGVAKIWDLASGDELLTLTNHTGGVYDGVFSPDGSTLVTISADGTARLWDATTGAETRRLTGHTGAVSDVELLSHSNQVVTVSADGTLRIWNADPTRARDRLNAHDASAEVVWVDESRLLTIGYPDTVVKLWDARTEQLIRTYEGAGVHHAIAVSPDRSSFAVGPRLYDLESGQLLRDFAAGFWVNDNTFSPDGRMLAVGGMTSGFDEGRTYTGTVAVWDIESGQRFLLIGQHENEVTAVRFSPDSAVLASASLDGTVKLWDVATGDLITTLDHGAEVNFISFTPDGAGLLASGSSIDTALWNVATSEVIRTFTGGGAASRGAGISPDGTTIATADLDGSLRFWGAATAAEQRRVVGFRSALSLPSFSPDGRLVAVAAEDGTVFLVRASVDDLMAETCALLPRDLSDGERERYMVGDSLATCAQFAAEGQDVLAFAPTATSAPVSVPTASVALPTPTSQARPFAPLAVSRPNEGSILPGETESWLHVGQTGQVLTLRASANQRAYDVDDYFTGLDTLLVVFGPDGSVVAQNDDAPDGSGDAELTIEITDAGIYRIEVRSAGLATGGGYVLTAALGQ